MSVLGENGNIGNAGMCRGGNQTSTFVGEAVVLRWNSTLKKKKKRGTKTM